MNPTNENTINLVLTYHWFDLIYNKLKMHEYRLFKKYSEKKHIAKKIKNFTFYSKPLYLRLQRGYTSEFIIVNVLLVDVVNGLKTDLKTDEKVYDFFLGDIIETNFKEQ